MAKETNFYDYCFGYLEEKLGIDFSRKYTVGVEGKKIPHGELTEMKFGLYVVSNIRRMKDYFYIISPKQKLNESANKYEYLFDEEPDFFKTSMANFCAWEKITENEFITGMNRIILENGWKKNGKQ